jgi:MYXO-CTERM domain-containing protein
VDVRVRVGEPEVGVLLGFPFETIAGADARLEVMAAILAFFEVEEAEPEDPGGTSTGPDDSGSSGESTAGPEGSDTNVADTDTDDAGLSSPGEGCGCRSTAGTPPWLVLLVFALRRRTRSRPRGPQQ